MQLSNFMILFVSTLSKKGEVSDMRAQPLNITALLQALPMLDKLREALSSEEKVRELFLRQVLAAYYDSYVSPDGITPAFGHALYRLTDFIALEERLRIEIYPKRGKDWYMLEDWRHAWETDFPAGIPELPATAIEDLRKAITA